jgi:UDP-N-acetylglucosamine diphosphorylase / glucose-1-phosphate thymidylyltransferase / UDP-N-acetylgalactosamine diphosphorylase / glucosamine-1-phosphate N-acetyltransferase / galactosamine-1-phosphate N-acetyltransferase
MMMMTTATAPHTPPAVTVIIPMAGNGSRFAQAGYTDPKPFIPVAGKRMIEWVLDNLSLPNVNFILIARQDHLEAYPQVVVQLQAKYPITFVTVTGLT